VVIVVIVSICFVWGVRGFTCCCSVLCFYYMFSPMFLLHVAFVLWYCHFVDSFLFQNRVPIVFVSFVCLFLFILLLGGFPSLYTHKPQRARVSCATSWSDSRLAAVLVQTRWSPIESSVFTRWQISSCLWVTVSFTSDTRNHLDSPCFPHVLITNRRHTHILRKTKSINGGTLANHLVLWRAKGPTHRITIVALNQRTEWPIKVSKRKN
jgi:hypothetical protein